LKVIERGIESDETWNWGTKTATKRMDFGEQKRKCEDEQRWSRAEGIKQNSEEVRKWSRNPVWKSF
jgi:hypothetical protein